MADLVQVAPEDFGKQSFQAIEDNINTKYANKVSQRHQLLFSILGKPIQAGQAKQN